MCPDLHKHFDNCKKNPGHQQFIPINDFTIEHLPDGHHDTDLYHLIKAAANLTVRVSVQMTSPHRPEFWPNTNVPYPFYDKRGNVNNRTGSGRITVNRFIDGQGYDEAGKKNNDVTGEIIESKYKTCPCDKCVNSDVASNIWWEIYVYTASYVVFDEIEASHTSCRLFYNSDDSPLVTIDKFSLYRVDVERDECVIKYVTCEDFGKQLYEMNVHWYDLWRKVDNKFRKRSDVIFIVSHPHGCSQQVSVGHLKDKHKVGEYNDEYDMTKLTYTTGACPGSGGASVYGVGFRGFHVHSGFLDNGLNYSNVGLTYRK